MMAQEEMRAREARSENKKKDRFAKWLDEPMTRMGLSFIPAGEHQDGLRLLLQSAFDAGFNCGAGDAMSDVVEHLIKPLLKDKPKDMP